MLNVFFISLKKIIMKKTILTSLMTFIFLLNVNAQQWIENNSCNKKASEIVNEAITSLSNLEHLMAIGMAKAALVVDKDCECAKLVIAAAASNNADWGSRDDKLKEINLKKLSEVEKAWYSLLSTPNDKFNESAGKALDNHPNSPLINWINARQDMDLNKAFAEKYPSLASGAYNTIAYAFARDGDFDSAYKALDYSLRLHEGPNALDSRAEIAVMEGDYQKAFNNQLKAFDYAPFASPYQPKLVTYSRNLNKEKLIKNLKEAQTNVQDAIENQDLEEWKKYISEDMMVTSGDSSLSEFYLQTEEQFLEKRNFTWDSFDLRDMEVDFSPDMNTAVLRFYANGAYTFNETNEKVEYSTRASAVWISTGSGWKMVHANWAPFGGSGIPE
jgi:ketosteroid isomerase-like protein